MISKKIVLWISLLGSLYFTSLFFVNVGNYCYYHMWCEKVLSWLDFIGFNIFVFPVILFFSLLTYKMREGVYIYWMKFARWYILGFVILTYIIKSQRYGGDFAGGMSSWFAAAILFFLLVIFFIISVILISKRYTELKNENK